MTKCLYIVWNETDLKGNTKLKTIYRDKNNDKYNIREISKFESKYLSTDNDYLFTEETLNLLKKAFPDNVDNINKGIHECETDNFDEDADIELHKHNLFDLKQEIKLNGKDNSFENIIKHLNNVEDILYEDVDENEANALSNDIIKLRLLMNKL